MGVAGPALQMWATFGLIAIALALYTHERVPMVLTSLGVIAALLLLFHVFPLIGPDGTNLLAPKRILEGFSNPALITLMALLVVGQALTRTGMLDRAANLALRAGGGSQWRTVVLTLAVVLMASGFLNNIPVVVIFIPIMQSLADRLGRPASRLMIPLSYAAILGGMTTLIGSSTNLLVSSSLIELGLQEFSFFEFTVPGLVLAATGLAYVLLIAPRLMPERAATGELNAGGGGKQFIAEIGVADGSNIVGQQSVGGFFPGLREMTVRTVRRAGQAFLPPFDEITIQPGDLIVVAATRGALTEALTSDPTLLGPLAEAGKRSEEPKRAQARVVAEVMVSPASRMIGQTISQIGFRRLYNVGVLGIQRRTRMLRAGLSEIRLEAGDVLLVQGEPESISALRGNPDMILMEWSAADLPSPFHTRRALAIFLAMVALAGSGIVPIVTAAVGAAAAMIATGCLTVRQAARSVDFTIVMMIGAALGLGVALEETGGASFLADNLIRVLEGARPMSILSAFFLLVSMLTTVLDNKACAVLFTPIGVEIARGLGVDPIPFAVAVVFAANCCFASPIGYQTNLLVMAPGNYKFVDFVRAGLPLNIVLWLAFSLFGPWYYGV